MYLAQDREYVSPPRSWRSSAFAPCLGVDSPRGSPFNVQRSLQIPNLTRDEVVEMFQQYQSESGQVVDPDVVQAVFDSTRGQPGLVGWFGELLTEKYNPGKDKPITSHPLGKRVPARITQRSWNNTLLNLGEKSARALTAHEVMKLFTDPNVEFSLREGLVQLFVHEWDHRRVA
jgi:hypothetical protein